MYFEPSKKTYYRFPSTSRLQDFDSKYYFPKQSHTSGEDARFTAQEHNQMSNREIDNDIR